MHNTTAQLLQAALAITYVSSIYVHPNGRLRFMHHTKLNGAAVRLRSRNDPMVIRTRLVAVSIATVLSCFAVGAAVWREGGGWGVAQVRALSSEVRLRRTVDFPNSDARRYVLVDHRPSWSKLLSNNNSISHALSHCATTLHWPNVHPLA